MVAPGATVVTNGLRSYLSLGGKGFLHERVLAGEAKASEKGPSGVMYYTPTPERSPLLCTASCVWPPVYGRNTLRPRPDLIFERCIAALVSCPVWTYRDIVGK